MKIGDWAPLEPEVLQAMVDLGGNFPGIKTHLDLGSGDGRVMDAALAAGLLSFGIEIEPSLAEPCIARGLNVTLGDLFEHDLSGYDLYTAWFTDKNGSLLLLDKLWNEMKKNKRLVWLYDSRQTHRHQPDEGIPPHVWRPAASAWVFGNLIHLYVR